MFADIRQFQEMYNWADQEKEDNESWNKFHEEMSHGFCSGRHRHCHWGAFYHYWDAHWSGDDLGKICNRLDETGCNGPPFDDVYW